MLRNGHENYQLYSGKLAMQTTVLSWKDRPRQFEIPRWILLDGSRNGPGHWMRANSKCNLYSDVAHYERHDRATNSKSNGGGETRNKSVKVGFKL